jgi:MoxR-like ATPase
LDSDENHNLLLCGPPASAKTLFLLGILECRRGVYFDGSNTTNRILDVLQEERPRVICIDELDKMSRQFQNQLLNFLDGRIKVDKQHRSYDFEIKSAKVFATCNEINRLSKPLQSRFRRLYLPPYTKEQFLNISVKVCPKLKEDTSRIIGEEVWKQGSKDIRDIISLGKLIRKGDEPKEIEGLAKTFCKYADVN